MGVNKESSEITVWIRITQGTECVQEYYRKAAVMRLAVLWFNMATRILKGYW